MKKIIIVFACIFFFSGKAQNFSCSNFNLMLDRNHYTVTGGVDSSYVKYIQFDLGDTSSVARINYTFSDLTGGTSRGADYVFPSMPATGDLTLKDNCTRSQNTVRISLGYFHYDGKNFRVTIKLYDSNASLLSSTDYSFSH